MLNKSIIKLNPRLEKIAELTDLCNTVADIGTDHAYIPVRLVMNGKAKNAIASDIKKGPVARAKDTVGKYGLENSIDIRLGAGLETVSPGEADVIIIAGMGGILISDILSSSQRVVRAAKQLILQPMTAVYELREYLAQNNYSVSGEYLVREEEKIYNIIVASPNGNCEYSPGELYLGKGLDHTSPELYSEYRQRIVTKLKKRAEGLQKSNLEENKLELEKILNTISELANY